MNGVFQGVVRLYVSICKDSILYQDQENGGIRMKKYFSYEAAAAVLLASVWQVWNHQHLGVKSIRQLIISYVINLWDHFVKQKGFSTHLLHSSLSKLKEKNPNCMQGARYQPAHFPSEGLSKMKTQMLDENPFLPTCGWSGYIICVASCVRKELQAIRQMVAASISVYSIEEEDCSSPFRICPFFGMLLMASRVRRNILNTLKQNEIKFSP